MTHLARSGDTLFTTAEAFIRKNADVVVLSAYIKKATLEKLNESCNINQVVVAWKMQDICSGASDFEELYEYCRDNNIELFRNTRIHLKVIWDYAAAAFLGSANISNRGIQSKGSNFNWELSAIVNNLSVEDQQYLQQRILESQLITDERMKALRKFRDSIQYDEPEIPSFELSEEKTDRFLINQLPFFRDVDSLFHAYANPESLSHGDMKDLAHDLALYRVPSGLSLQEFEAYISNAFLNHPFIESFCHWVKAIKPNHPDPNRKASVRFGSVTQWFTDHTTTVPTPRPWELSEDINVLYNWICYFDPDFQQTGRPYGGGTRGSNLLQYRPCIT